MEITGREEPRFPSVELNERRDAALIAALRGNSWPSCRSTRSASFPSVSWSALASGSGSPNIGAGTRTIAPDCDNRRRNRGAGAGPAHGSSRKRIQQLAAKEIIPRTAKRKFPLLGGIRRLCTPAQRCTAPGQPISNLCRAAGGSGRGHPRPRRATASAGKTAKPETGGPRKPKDPASNDVPGRSDPGLTPYIHF